MSDGEKILKFVSFSVNDQKKLSDHFTRKESVSLQGCSVQKGKDGDDVELMIGDSSSILKRPRKFNVCDEEWTRIDPDSLVEITLDKLQE